MYLILSAVWICLILQFAAFVIEERRVHKGFPAWSRLRVLSSAAATFVVLTVACVVLNTFVFSPLVPMVHVVGDSKKMVTLQHPQNVTGHYVLGVDIIRHESPVYTFYAKADDGTVHSYGVYINSPARIIEDSALKDEGLYQAIEFVPDANFWAAKWSMSLPYPQLDHYEFHVPKGAILYDFDIEKK